MTGESFRCCISDHGAWTVSGTIPLAKTLDCAHNRIAQVIGVSDAVPFSPTAGREVYEESQEYRAVSPQFAYGQGVMVW
jgi:hypothetical protein